MRDPQLVLSTRPERSRVLPIVRTIRPRVLNESLSYVGELITLTNPPTTPDGLGRQPLLWVPLVKKMARPKARPKGFEPPTSRSVAMTP
jgi:hypothetical protein